MSDQPIAIFSSPTPVQYSTPHSVSGNHPHLLRNSASILSRPSVDSWYIRTSAGSDHQCNIPPQVSHSSRNYPQSGTSMSQQQPPQGRTSLNDNPVDSGFRGSVQQFSDARQLRSPIVYASAHHTTPQHTTPQYTAPQYITPQNTKPQYTTPQQTSASTSNGRGHLYRQNPQVVVPAGPGHQGVGYQQAESAGLGLSNVPLSPYQAWTSKQMKPNAYHSLLPSPSPLLPSLIPQQLSPIPQQLVPAQQQLSPHRQQLSPTRQHTPYYASTHNNSLYMTMPQSQRQQHQTTLTDISQSYADSEGLNGQQSYANPEGLNGQQNWSRSPHTPYDPHHPQMYGRPSASPHMNYTVPNGSYRNESSSIAPHPQHHIAHTTKEWRPSTLLYTPPPPPRSPPPPPPPSLLKRPNSLRKRIAESPPTTDERPHTRRRNVYADKCELTSVSSHAQRDVAARKSPQNGYPVPSHAERETAVRASSQSKLPIDQSRRETQQQGEIATAAGFFEQEYPVEIEIEPEWMKGVRERQEAQNRLVDARIRDCKTGGPKSCTALMKDPCWHCMKRQTSRR